jgi:hypothetical protein
MFKRDEKVFAQLGASLNFLVVGSFRSIIFQESGIKFFITIPKSLNSLGNKIVKEVTFYI